MFHVPSDPSGPLCSMAMMSIAIGATNRNATSSRSRTRPLPRASLRSCQVSPPGPVGSASSYATLRVTRRPSSCRPRIEGRSWNYTGT